MLYFESSLLRSSDIDLLATQEFLQWRKADHILLQWPALKVQLMRLGFDGVGWLCLRWGVGQSDFRDVCVDSEHLMRSLPMSKRRGVWAIHTYTLT